MRWRRCGRSWRRACERRSDPHAASRTTSPPTCSTRCRATRGATSSATSRLRSAARSARAGCSASVEMLPAAVEQLEPPPGAARAADGDRARGGGGGGCGRGLGTCSRAPLPARRARRRSPVVLAAPAADAGAGGGADRRGRGAAFLVSNGGDDSGNDTVISAVATSAEPGAKGSLVRSGDQGILRIDRLPLHRGKVYQVWVVEDGQAPRSAALFDVNRGGQGSGRHTARPQPRRPGAGDARAARRQPPADRRPGPERRRLDGASQTGPAAAESRPSRSTRPCASRGHPRTGSRPSRPT